MLNIIRNYFQNRENQKTINFVCATLQNGGWLVNDTKWQVRTNVDGSTYKSRRGIRYQDLVVDRDTFVLYDTHGAELQRYSVELIKAMGFNLDTIDFNNGIYNTDCQGYSICGEYKLNLKSSEYGYYYLIENVDQALGLTDSEIAEQWNYYTTLEGMNRAAYNKRYPQLAAYFNQ